MVRAMRSYQANIPVYMFFLPGAKILEIADVCRLTRTKEAVDGFQRDAIKRHISAIVDYLNTGDVLFPNAVLLALSPRVNFVRSRGPTPKGMIVAGEPGRLELLSHSDGSKCGWIVDGQQRSIALANASHGDRPVPVVAFASDDLQLHREQFILVNKARPLPRRLVDELLPEVDAAHLPVDMAVRQIPSALVNRLDADPKSPFFGLIRRTTTKSDPARVITDSALVKAFQRQIHQPLGSLNSFRTVDGASTDPNGMYKLICAYWAAVKDVFADAWGLPPEQSRLMHSAGITALGALMDYLVPRSSQHDDFGKFVRESLRRISPQCAWTAGRWPDLNCAWNDIESTASGVRRLTEQLVRMVQAPRLQKVVG